MLALQDRVSPCSPAIGHILITPCTDKKTELTS